MDNVDSIIYQTFEGPNLAKKVSIFLESRFFYHSFKAFFQFFFIFSTKILIIINCCLLFQKQLDVPVMAITGLVAVRKQNNSDLNDQNDHNSD